MEATSTMEIAHEEARRLLAMVEAGLGEDLTLADIASAIRQMGEDPQITQVIAEVPGSGTLVIGPGVTKLVLQGVGIIELPSSEIISMFGDSTSPEQ